MWFSNIFLSITQQIRKDNTTSDSDTSIPDLLDREVLNGMKDEPEINVGGVRQGQQ